jgi:hypothetical protein
MAQVVDYLSTKHKVLSSNPTIAEIITVKHVQEMSDNIKETDFILW